MQVVHDPETGAPTTLATDVEVADSLLSKALGLMGRRTVPEEYALAFRFGRSAARTVHMVFVRTPIDVVWVADREVQRATTLSAWTGLGRAEADTILELAPGAAADVEAGDRVWIEE